MKTVTTSSPEHPSAPNPAFGDPQAGLNRRGFLKTAAQVGALLMAPQVVRGAVLGRDGGVAPSERIVLGGIGIGGRGTYDLGCFLEEPDVHFVAVCDVKAARREAIKRKADTKYGNQDCATYRDLRELLARERHRGRPHRHRPQLARHRRLPRRQCRQGRVLRKALHQEHRPEPRAGRDVPPHRPHLPGRHAAPQPA